VTVPGSSRSSPPSSWALAAGLAAWGGAFLKTKGEYFATKRDFDELQKQLSATTKLVETIKSEVSQREAPSRHRPFGSHFFKLLPRARKPPLNFEASAKPQVSCETTANLPASTVMPSAETVTRAGPFTVRNRCM